MGCWGRWLLVSGVCELPLFLDKGMADEIPTGKVGKGSFWATRSYVERGITVTDRKSQYRAGSQKVVL